MQELDYVVLTHDLPELRLRAGDVGMIVHIRGAHEAYEVEFVSLSGELLALVSLTSTQVRPVAEDEIAHVRRMPSG